MNSRAYFSGHLGDIIGGLRKEKMMFEHDSHDSWSDPKCVISKPLSGFLSHSSFLLFQGPAGHQGAVGSPGPAGPRVRNTDVN